MKRNHGFVPPSHIQGSSGLGGEVSMSHETVLARIRAEYLEMPGLQLTPTQAQRLCGIEGRLCKIVLNALVDTNFLCLKPNGAYARVSDGADDPHLDPAR
jgi:hypothetical protein